jgi:hypothetical protein
MLGSLKWPPLISGHDGGLCPPEFLPLFNQLREAKFNLQQASGGLEQQFLATSSELETLAGIGNRFVQQVERLVGLATGKGCDGSAFSGAIQLIEQSTEFLAGCQTQTEQTLEQLRDYSAKIKNLLGVENELQRAMLPLKFVQTLFKSECAPLGLETQQMFHSLTHEIEGMHGQVRDIFGTKFQQLQQTQSTLRQVIAQLDRQAGSLRQVTAANKAHIESTLATLKIELEANQKRDLRLSRLTRDVAREVEQIVMGLQFQDIVNQKMLHVTEALPQIEAKFAEFKNAANASGAIEPTQFLHQCCRLNAGQLLAAQEELASAEKSIQEGIQKVLARMTEIDSECLSLEDFKVLTTSFDGIVQVLVETFEQIRTMVDETVARAAEAYEILRPLGSLASDLTAIVRRMSAQIHLIGLNAEVQATRAAEDSRGAGLVVLSARTSEISRETNNISEVAAAQLDALVAGLTGTVKAFGQLRADGLARQTVLNQQGGAEEEQLHEFRNGALATLREMGDSLDAIRTQSHRTLDTVQFTQFHQVTLPELRSPLVAIAETAERWLQTHGCGLAQVSLMEGFKSNYTMASEHAVFASVTPSIPSDGPPSATAAPSPVEIGLPGESHSCTPEKAEAPPVEAVSAAAGGSGLGANVELF